LEKKQKGEIVIEGSNDVLTQALGNPEHSGRVRGVGGFSSLSNYFGLPRQRRVVITKAELMARDKERDRELMETKKLLIDHQSRTHEMVNEAVSQAIAAYEARQVTENLVASPPITPLSDKGSHQGLRNTAAATDMDLHNLSIAEDDLLTVPPPSDKVLNYVHNFIVMFTIHMYTCAEL
jgi:hypothetical protein